MKQINPNPKLMKALREYAEAEKEHLQAMNFPEDEIADYNDESILISWLDGKCHTALDKRIEDLTDEETQLVISYLHELTRQIKNATKEGVEYGTTPDAYFYELEEHIERWKARDRNGKDGNGSLA